MKCIVKCWTSNWPQSFAHIFTTIARKIATLWLWNSNDANAQRRNIANTSSCYGGRFFRTKARFYATRNGTRTRVHAVCSVQYTLIHCVVCALSAPTMTLTLTVRLDFMRNFVCCVLCSCCSLLLFNVRSLDSFYFLYTSFCSKQRN